MTRRTRSTDPYRPRRRPLWRRLVSAVLITLTAFLAAAAIATQFGVLQADLVETNSMSCSASSKDDCFDAGALILSRRTDGADFRVGDIAVLTRDSGTVVAHRVIEVDPSTGTTAVLRLQGDANPEPDPEIYDVTDATRVFLAVPRIGTIAYALFRPPAMYYLAAGVLLGAITYLYLVPYAARRPEHDDGDVEGAQDDPVSLITEPAEDSDADSLTHAV